MVCVAELRTKPLFHEGIELHSVPCTVLCRLSGNPILVLQYEDTALFNSSFLVLFGERAFDLAPVGYSGSVS